MSHTTRSIYASDPATFDATQEVVSIGDLVVDPAGVNPPGLVTGPNSARTVAPLGGSPPPPPPAPNTITLTQSGSSANLSIVLTVKDGAGVPIVGAPINWAMSVAPFGGTLTITAGADIYLTAGGRYVGLGLTTAGGLFTIDFNSTPGNGVELIYGSGPIAGTLTTTVP